MSDEVYQAYNKSIYYEDKKQTSLCNGSYKEHMGTFHYKDGIFHRVDGPAIEYSGGEKEWWLYGERHRVDGPAIEYSSGKKEWWLYGEILYYDGYNNLNEYSDLSESFKRSIIKYELSR
jgi:hypothetical protein